MKYTAKYLRFLAFGAIFVLAGCSDAVDTFNNTIDSISEYGLPSVSQELQQKPLSDRLLNQGGCPSVEIVDDLGALYDYQNTSRPSDDTLVSSVILSKIASTCVYGPKSVTIDMKLGFSGILGPLGHQSGSTQPSFSYPYFVAVMSPGGQVLSKEVFAAPLTYNYGLQRQTYSESLRQIIPIVNQENGMHHKIVIGFQLSKPQLDYNRLLIKRRDASAAAQALKERKVVEQSKESLIKAQDQGLVSRDVELQPVPQSPTQKSSQELLDQGPIVLSPAPDVNAQQGNTND